MKKRLGSKILVIALTMAMLTGCGNTVTQTADTNTNDSVATESTQTADTYEGIQIVLSDDAITVDGAEISTDETSAVYVGADIEYYMADQGDTYGEGSKEEEHTAEEATEQTVVTITQPGTYIVSGTLSKGQIVIDLGDDVQDDENAVVNLVLNHADITCSVASAILVRNVYECGSDDVDMATMDVDTSTAGFNLFIADNSVNTITGSHVAKVYKEGTTAEEIAADEAKKAYKYDAAIESMMSFNINGGTLGNGKLIVNADNEGIESKLHLTINGGELTVNANDDSINAGEDYVSVITINGGIITCDSGSGDGDEGDGIDSNGWIVINDGYVIACANARSMDSGIDTDMGAYINGGTVLASGHMYDEVAADSTQQFIVLSFNEDVTEDEIILLKDSEGNPVTAFEATNDYSVLVYSCPELTEGEYSLYKVDSVKGDLNGSIYTNITGDTNEVQLQYTSGSMGRGAMGSMGAMGNGSERPDGEMPEDVTDAMGQGEGGGRQFAEGEMPELPDGEMPAMAEGEAPAQPDGEMPTMAEGEAPAQPDGEMPAMADGEAPTLPENITSEAQGEASTVFSISTESYQFAGISAVEAN